MNSLWNESIESVSTKRHSGLKAHESAISAIINQAGSGSEDPMLILSSSVLRITAGIGEMSSLKLAMSRWNRHEIDACRPAIPAPSLRLDLCSDKLSINFMPVCKHQFHGVGPEPSLLYTVAGEVDPFTTGSAGDVANVVLLLSNIFLHLLQNSAAPTPIRIRQPITREVNSMEVWLSAFTGTKMRAPPMIDAARVDLGSRSLS